MNVAITRDNGILKVNIDGTLYPPLSFKSFRPNAQNISEFYRAGVRLFSVLSSGITSALGVPYSLYGESWVGEGAYDFSAIDRQMELFLANAPDGYFAPMLQIDTRNWYLEAHPDTPNSFTHLSQTAYDENWKAQAAAYLKAAIRHCEERYGDRIYGYFILGGTTTEWFSERDYEASHPLKEAGYRKWTGDDTAKLPSLEALNRAGRVFLDESEGEVFRARRFHSETIAELILFFAGEAQQVLQHKKLLGVYYGYLFELGGERLFNDGSLAYEKVFASDDINMISSPSAYGYRALTDPSAFMVTQKTLDLHRKLYFLEFDHITHVAPSTVEDEMQDGSGNRFLAVIPGAEARCKNETESLNLMYRDFVLCSANSAAMWWFDMFDGWFRSDGMMAAVRRMVAVADRLAQTPVASAAEIAVFAEGESMYGVRKSAGIATKCLSDIRRTLAECGAPYDLYSICDLTDPAIKRYRLLLFVNPYELSDAEKQYIQAELERDGRTVLWLYAPAYRKGVSGDAARISAVTGIHAAESDRSHGGLVFGGETTDYQIAAPYFSIDDRSAAVLAEFSDGTTAAAMKRFRDFTSVYVATCNLPSALLREIARRSGVFLYSENARVYTYTNSAVLGVYNATGEAAFVNVRTDGTYRDLLSSAAFRSENGVLSIPKAEINAFLLVKEG